MAAKPMASDSGMEIMTTNAARKPSGNSVSETNKMAIAKSLTKRASRLLTLTDWSKFLVSWIVGGNVLANASIIGLTFSPVLLMLLPAFWANVTNAARWPLRRVRWVSSS